MRHILLLLSLCLFSFGSFSEEIGSVNYRFKWVGPSDKIAVEAFDDPEASIACRKIGDIDPSVLTLLKNGQEVFSARASAIFKTTQVVRFVDTQRAVLVYLTYTDRIVDGSPENSISVVPIR
jgi:CreA protein